MDILFQRITTSPSNGSINGTIPDDINKCSNGIGFAFEVQNNTLNQSPSMSPTQITPSPNVPNKRDILTDSNSLPNSEQAVPISSQNSTSTPLENESNVAVGENNASPKYTGQLITHFNHINISMLWLESVITTIMGCEETELWLHTIRHNNLNSIELFKKCQFIFVFYVYVFYTQKKQLRFSGKFIEISLFFQFPCCFVLSESHECLWFQRMTQFFD